MKNYEKYANEIKEYSGERFCDEFVRPKIHKKSDCKGMECERCALIQALWLLEEYEEPVEPEEPEIDWSTVEVDTPILASADGDCWVNRHFARYEDGTVYTWINGNTSWSTNIETAYNYAKLAEAEAGKEK